MIPGYVHIKEKENMNAHKNPSISFSNNDRENSSRRALHNRDSTVIWIS